MEESMHILLVEDNPGDVRLIREMLKDYERIDFKIENAQSLNESIDLLNKEQFEVVLLDLGLPDSQGLETFEKISSHMSELPIVILTGLDDEEIALKAIKKGAQDYLVKNNINSELLVRFLRYAIERRKAEEALRKLEEKYDIMLRSIGDHMSMMDEDLNILWANAIAKEIFGNDIIGKKCYKVYHGREEPCDGGNCLTIKTFKDGNIHEHDTEVIDKNGGIIYFHCTANVALRDKDRNPMAVIEISRNITERKKTEEALRESEEKYRIVFERAGDYVLMLDVEQGEIPIIMDANEAALETHGYSRDEIIGKPITHFDKQMTPEMLLERKQLIDTKGGGILFCHHTRKDGTEFDVEANIQLIQIGKKHVLLSIERDITERKQAEEALRASEKRYSFLFNQIADAIYVSDIDGHLTQVNEQACKDSGYTETELLELTISDVDDVLTTSEDVEKSLVPLEIGAPITLESRHKRKDGTTYPVEITVSQIDTPDGMRVLGVARDITDRKKAEEALRTSEAQLSNAMEIAKLGYWEYDVDNDLFTFNDHFYDIFRTTAEKVGGYKMSSEQYAKQFIHPDDMAVVGVETRKAIETTDPNFSRQLEHRIIYADGEIGYISVRFFIIKDSHGRTIKTYGANQDITERKRVDEEIKVFSNAVAGAIDAIAITDMKGIITYANSAMEETYGYKKGEILGKSVIGLNPNQEMANEIMSALIKVGNWNGEIESIKKNKDTFPALLSLSTVRDEKGNPIAMMGAVRDITERKRAETERERLLKMLESKNKELEQIVYVFSHDLRSPLVNVQGFSKELEYAIEDLRKHIQIDDVPENIREHFDSTVNDDIMESLGYIQSSIFKMDRLLNGLLRISRLGRAALEMKKLDMNRMIKEILDDFEYRIKENGVEVKVSDLPSCRGDVTQINQVFSNLISNALKYFDPKRPGNITISGYAENYRSVYCIEDNGIGIAPEHYNKIFELFHQLDPDTSDGDGMGLTIVNMILERQFGKIWLESEPDKGCKFYVELPGK